MKRRGGGNIFFPFLFRIQKKKQDQKYKLFFQSVSGKKSRRESSSDTSHYSRLLKKCNLNFENPLPHSHLWGHQGKGPPLGRGQNCLQTAAENSHLLYKGSSGQFTDSYKAQRHISIESVGYSGLEWYWIMLDIRIMLISCLAKWYRHSIASSTFIEVFMFSAFMSFLSVVAS